MTNEFAASRRRKIEREAVRAFREYLLNEEKAVATVMKYVRDVDALAEWLGERALDKRVVLEYKTYLTEKYAPASVNAALASLNRFFSYCRWTDLRVRSLKIQRRVFASEERELTRGEYERLLMVAQRKSQRLYLLMQAICSTGIRVSELRFITVDAVKKRRAEIRCKGKCRSVLLPEKLCRMLERYLSEKKITGGSVFVTKNGKPLDRSNVWADMKSLCRAAGVAERKVFPHNLRHLFARTYYSMQRDVVRLADILGHSSIDTTRIYTMESGEIHRRQIQGLGLLRC